MSYIDNKTVMRELLHVSLNFVILDPNREKKLKSHKITLNSSRFYSRNLLDTLLKIAIN